METLRGFTSQDLNKLNNNTLKVYKKLFNKFKFSDMDYSLQQRIRLQTMTINGVGNFDSTIPYTYFFFVPTAKYKLSGGTVNLLLNKYRTDVDTKVDGTTTGGSLETTLNGSGEIMTSAGSPIDGHRHGVSISAHKHTGTVTIPNHKHTLEKKITVEADYSDGVVVKVNETIVANLSSSATQKNNIDLKDLLKVGWNSITCSSTSLARITLYGIIELTTDN